MTRTVHCLLLAVLLSGCKTPAVSPTTTGPISPSGLSKDDQVRLAVFKDFLARTDGDNQKAVYLSIGHHKDPSEGLMVAIGSWRTPVKTVSQCTTDPRGVVVDKETLKRGYILSVSTIKWIDADTAELQFSLYQAPLGAHGYELRVHRQNDQWEVHRTENEWVS